MRKWIVVLIAALTLFSIGGAALAQDPSAVFCGSLAEADCAILQQSAAASMQMSSASAKFELNVSVAGLFGPTPIVLSVVGDGSYAITDPTALAGIQNLTSLTSGNPADMAKAFGPLLKAFSGDLNLTINIPPELAMMAAMQSTGDTPPPQIPPSISLGLRMVDGVGYVNLEGVAALDASGQTPKGWIGMDLVKAMEQAMASGMGANSTGTATDAVQNMDALAKFMKVERLADTTVDGQPAAVFQTTLDLAGLLSSPELMQTMQSQGGSDSASMQQSMMAAQAFLTGVTAVGTQTITLNDFYNRAASAEIKIPLDMAALMGGADSSSSGPSQKLDIAITMSTTVADINSAAPIAAPEGAQMGDPAMMMGSMGS
jgi:hypothetical protein